jgi:hypothetical protein
VKEDEALTLDHSPVQALGLSLACSQLPFSDFVEVLTEIDIQTPIPKVVQRLHTVRPFLFLSCRFQSQLERTFARQIMKRSSDTHWAVLYHF